MTRFAIDPVTFLAVVRGPQRVHPDHQLVAPGSLRSRALELLLHEVDAGDLDEREALAVHERLTEVKVRLLGDRVSRRTAWALAREHGWSGLEDAEVLAVARLQADALVTHDEGLRARATGVVPVAPVERLFAPG